ncbi:MAG: bifunctional methylenetetrahydrofolate dehydrogenase/methenyltetrahydrofolate cyclohydrolase FolD [Bryobacterales bacterium]|nr:bifunctional methylenetetrahydrofolate dehydrogenase/methenyltetrahydrofolate cyclohydrolase FolD [Bryobacterales bacterium]
MPKILNGNLVRDEILTELKPRVERCRSLGGRPPGLAVVLAGDDPASHIYVRNKVKACQALGLHSVEVTPPAAVATEELLGVVGMLNRDPAIDGILVQMPLPKQVDSRRILEAISPEKDADGFHPISVGRLVANLPGPRACTPAGVMEMLRRQGIDPLGKQAVVVGRSDIVGKPMALLLLHAHATVTICHSKTADLPGVCRRADILVAAMGRPAFVRREFIKPGAVVVDVGINRVASRAEAERIWAGAPERLAEFDRKRSLLVGDVHPLEVEATAAYTPVPGGVGPLTIAMLMANTVELAERRLQLG